MHRKLVVSFTGFSTYLSGTITNSQEYPVCNVELSTDSMDGVHLPFNVVVCDLNNPNFQIIIGRDFLDIFKSVEYNGKKQNITMNF